MRTFAEKPKASQQNTLSRPTMPHRSHFGYSHEVNSILNQRTIGDQAALRMLGRSTEVVEGDSTAAGIPRFGHNFSQIPVHTSMPRTIQALQTDSRMRDRHPQEAASSIAGKLGARLPDEGPWIETTGNGGPVAKSDMGLPEDGGAAAFTPAPAPGVFPPNPPPPPSPPKISKKTVSSPTARDCGGFKWVVQWELDKKTTKGGWVVQKVELPYNVKDCGDKAVDPTKAGGLQPSWYPLWEAWPIHKDQQVTTYAEGGDVEDDTYATNSPGSNTKGAVTLKGTAEFYDGLTLPSSFKVTNKAPAWILPATNSAPTLGGGTGAISHDLKATWDCCSKDKTATKATTVETT